MADGREPLEEGAHKTKGYGARKSLQKRTPCTYYQKLDTEGFRRMSISHFQLVRPVRNIQSYPPYSLLLGKP